METDIEPFPTDVRVLKPVIIDAPTEPEAPASATVAQQGTYKIRTKNGQEFEFAGLATTPDGSITLPSLIDLLLVIAASLDHPVVDQILKANDVIQKDAKGRLYYPRPAIADEIPQEINL